MSRAGRYRAHPAPAVKRGKRRTGKGGGSGSGSGKVRVRRKLLGMAGLTKSARLQHEMMMLGHSAPAFRLGHALRRLQATTRGQESDRQWRTALKAAKRMARLSAAFQRAQQEQASHAAARTQQASARVWDGKECRDNAGRLVGFWRYRLGKFEVVPL